MQGLSVRHYPTVVKLIIFLDRVKNKFIGQQQQFYIHRLMMMRYISHHHQPMYIILIKADLSIKTCCLKVPLRTERPNTHSAGTLGIYGLWHSVHTRYFSLTLIHIISCSKRIVTYSFQLSCDVVADMGD